MDRADWIAAFIDEMKKLRPQLWSRLSTSRIGRAIALQAHEADGNGDPTAAARRYDASIKKA